MPWPFRVYVGLPGELIVKDFEPSEPKTDEMLRGRIAFRPVLPTWDSLDSSSGCFDFDFGTQRKSERNWNIDCSAGEMSPARVEIENDSTLVRRWWMDPRRKVDLDQKLIAWARTNFAD